MSMKAVSGLNVYKKVAIIRKADDILTYEDNDGNVKTITDLHLAAAAATTIQKAKAKDDIPVPKIRDVENYKSDIPAIYNKPIAYVRHRKPSRHELRDSLEYVVDAEDEVWLINNTNFGKASSRQASHSSSSASSPGSARKRVASGEEKGTVQLPLDMFEIMLDVLEKATAFEAIVRLDQAENLILQKLPQLYHMYPIKAKAGVVTMRHVLTDIYNYWVSKRSKLKRPLMRRFWPVTSTDDTNPHLVFRPREKEKYKLRKKRQNDMEAYRKMEQLRQDFAHVQILCELVKQREELNRSLVLLQREWFRQKIYEAIDTSGRPRISKDVDKDQLDALMQVGKHFDMHGGWKKKKARRGNQQGSVSSQSSLPVPDGGLSAPHFSGMSTIGTASTESQKKPLIVAGQNHGEPAPNFLNPLATREGYRTSWEGVAPHVTTFVDAKPEPTFRFRHRPRVGRGGRLCIDRMPLPVHPNNPAPTFFRAGNSQVHPNEPKRRLVDLLPPPLDRTRISQRIEAISLAALKEDYETPPGGVAGPDGEENDGEVVLVPVKDWLNTDDQLWGEERYSVGPI